MKKIIILMLSLMIISPLYAKMDLEGKFQKTYKLGDGTGSDVSGPKSEDIITVKVFQQGKDYMIEFEVTRTYPGKTLWAKVPVEMKTEEKLEFNFEDDWENKSKGEFYRQGGKYYIDLKMIKKGKLGDAVSFLYDKWEVEKERANPKEFNEKGEKLFGEKKYDEALKQFETAISLDPVNVRAFGNMSLTLIKLEKYEQAEENAGKQLKYATDNKVKAAALYNMGLSQEKRGNKDKALIYYRKSLKLRKNKAVEAKIKELQK
ncbi:MAG: tetratricopeptide repeat protein [Spirochaetes bacterium]|nr:tetratricopeptide repeat protein [Spirochaetota bacterium]